MKKKGFTLIELLVVVVIIGVLAGVAVPLYFSAINSAHDREAQAALARLGAAYRTFRADYPGSSITPTAAGVPLADADFSGTPAKASCNVVIGGGGNAASMLRLCGYIDAIRPSLFATQFFFCDPGNATLVPETCCKASYAAMINRDGTTCTRYTTSSEIQVG